MAERIPAYLGQALAYLAFMSLVGYLAQAPAYTHFSPEETLIKVSFTHTAQRLGECRKRTAEELAELPPNMRKPMDCPRERSPMEVLIRLDGKPVYHETIPPSGLWGGGSASVYQRFQVEAGTHTLEARLRDDADLEDYNYTRKKEVELKGGAVFVIDFDPASDGFLFGRAALSGDREEAP